MYEHEKIVDLFFGSRISCTASFTPNRSERIVLCKIRKSECGGSHIPATSLNTGIVVLMSGKYKHI
ncbi:hypothetical protein [Fictibacillus sp. KU28468]|uniref:hypothetical protein n=1 Tax=Fictibacillus sp. KU28468 TaxID=2991053 RepID=UPI00223E5BA4|nr:hypothetical protein [Fictibacillus sp. KU28468]UZJ77737.1 hypothetical protein OKX00_16410 [Fictibacillus sp. KU28468]